MTGQPAGALGGVDPNEGMSGPRDGFDRLNLHRNKRSLTLNLKEPEGLKVFMRLVAKADMYGVSKMARLSHTPCPYAYGSKCDIF
jgi:hypothetical protein